MNNRSIPKKEAMRRLIKQQIALIDVLEEETRSVDLRLNDLIWSSFPNYGDTFKAMRGFRDCVFQGVTPPPELLFTIAESINKYLKDKSGTLTLDEAFKLRSKPRIGNAVKQKKT